MSATTRTDTETLDTLGGGKGIRNAMESKKPDGSGLYVRASVARELERKLNEMACNTNRDLENLEKAIDAGLHLARQREKLREERNAFASFLASLHNEGWMHQNLHENDCPNKDGNPETQIICECPMHARLHELTGGELR